MEQEQHHKSQKHQKKSLKNQEEEWQRGRNLSSTRAPSWDKKGVEENQEAEGSRHASRSRAPTWDRKATEVKIRKNRDEILSSQSVTRNRAMSWGTATSEVGAGLEVQENKRRSKRKEADILKDSVKKEYRESKQMVSDSFSFLMPQDERAPSESESAASFSEVSQSAASITWNEDFDWRRADLNSLPGPWLKPSHQKLTKVLIGSRLSGQSMVGGLSL